MKYLLVLLLPIISYGQQKFSSGKILYDYEMKSNIINEIKDFSERLKNDSKFISFTLEFENQQTFFYLNENLNSTNNFAIAFTKAKQSIYSDLERKKFYQSSPNSLLFEENEFTIEHDFIEWQLINESKVMDDRKVYKAIGKYKTLIKKEVIERELIAWYCPDIQLYIGPRGANNLPGLIISLEDNYGVFIAKKITFTDKVNLKNNLFEKEIINEVKFFNILLERREIIQEKFNN